MAQRPGGIDSAEIRAGFESLQRVRSARELEQMIEDLPVLSAPIFHSRLRYELHRQMREYGAPLPGYRQIYDHLFRCLHYRAHLRLSEAVHPPAGGRTRSDTNEPFAPPYFSELTAALAGRLPKAEGPTLNPAADATKIQAEGEVIVGRSVSLPEYLPTPGSRWSMILVACASCQHTWLKTCAYAIDLGLDPTLTGLWQDGRLNNSACPVCGEALCLPIRVWLQEEPGAGDALAALSCAWRLSDFAYVYQPPPGTPKLDENDFVMEIRANELLRMLGWGAGQNPKGEGAKNVFIVGIDDRARRDAVAAAGEGAKNVFIVGIAYTADQVSGYIDRSAKAGGGIPFEMEAMIHGVTRMLESGLLPIYDAQDFIRKAVAAQGGDWPLAISDDPLSNSSRPYFYLVLCLLAEACAEAQKLSDAFRAALAARTYTGFFSIQEAALAEAALARAEDLLGNSPPGDPNYAAAATAVGEARSQLLSFLGRHAEADQAREQVGKSPLLEGDSLVLRFSRLQLESQEALSLKRQGRLAEALGSYFRCVAALVLMKDEALSSEGESSAVLPHIRHMLSGDLANLAGVLITLGERLEAGNKLKELIEGGAGPKDVAWLLRSSGMKPDDLPATADAIPVLAEIYPSGFTPEMLFEEGREYLVKALELSEACEGWEFAGIQAHRLAGLLHFHFGETEASREIMLKAIGYASRAADHMRVATGHKFLADLAIEQGDGPTALTHLIVSAREEIREQVGRGYYARPDGLGLTISDAALRSAARGGDPRAAVAIAESLKIPTTAATMVSGLPARPGRQGGHAGGSRLSELLTRRELLRLESERKPQADTDEELRRIELEIEEERKAAGLRDPRFTRWVDATNLDVSDPEALLRRLRRLGPRTTLLGILPVGRTVWTYALWDGGCLIFEQPFPPFDGRTQYDYVAPSEAREIWDREYLEQLAAAVLGPLEARLSELGPDDRLIISTADPVALVPFSALPYRDKFFCEHVCVTQTQGTGVLEACLDRSESRFDSLLCVGNPCRPGWDDLPEAHAEAVTVAGRFREFGRRTLLLTYEDATVPNLKAEAAQYDVLHFACHADVAAAQAGSSRLILAPDSAGRDSGDLSEDRILSELPLRGGCLVNLAGCRTGVQSNSKGFLLGGLVPSFLIAGAGSVIGSLWGLNDYEAASFQIEFYRSLLNGSRPAEAFAKTQRACLRGELGPNMTDMRAWAGYLLYGAG